MNLIAISIRRPVFAWMLMSSMIIFGAIGLSKMGTSMLPDVDFPILTVSVNFEGASPEVVEAELIDPIEERLLAIEGIKAMKANVRQGAGSVTLEFDIHRNVDVVLQEVQAALSQLRLPPDVDPPVIRKQNPEESPIMFMSVYADKPLKEVIRWTETFLIDQLQFIEGIGEVSIGGFSARNMRIWPDLNKLRAADLTVNDVVDAIQTQHVEAAAGQFSNGQKELRVRWLGEVAKPEEIGNIRILRRGGQVIQDRVFRIKDVADVEDGLSDIRRLARVEGKEAVSIGIRKMRGGNEVALSAAVRQKVADLQRQLPEGYNLRINIDFTRPTKAVVDTTFEKLIFAAGVTILVCLLFLGSWQAAVNILFSIPTSIIGTFIILFFADFTMNLFTLLALTLAISIVVDDAIMLLENIVRHYRMGKNPAQAAYDGSMEILPAATAATLAVVAVFLPVIFMSGITGKFFFQFGVAMSAAVILSLIEAVTVTPMRAAAFMNAAPSVNRFEKFLDHLFEKLAAGYAGILQKTLKHSLAVVSISLVVFGVSLLAVKELKQEFVPSQDQDLILLSGQTPAGTDLKTTYEKALEVEEIIKKDPDVARFFMNVGSGGPSAEVNQFSMPLYLRPREERKIRHTEIMERLRGKLKSVKGVRVSMRDNSARGLTSGRQFPVSFTLSGPDLDVLDKSAGQMIDRLNKENLTQDMDTDFKQGLPELLIRPNRQAMANFSVTIDAVAKTLSTAVAGTRVSRFTTDGRRYDVRVKVRDEKIQSANDIKGIFVRNNYGNLVPLADLVFFENNQTYQSINRLNRQRAIGVFGNLKSNVSQGAALERAEKIAFEVLPDGYAFKLEGAAAGLAESFKSLTIALVLGILVAYMILATQFNSFVHPIAVLIALPFSVTGALLTLWAAGVSLNLFSFIGLIVLMGIAKKNSILLVEFTNQVREHGEKNVREALIKGCPVRLRPILMTSVATIAAAFPLVIGNSIGQETRTPMGLSIIGGSAFATVLTLFVVPSLYLLLSKLESKHKNVVLTETAAPVNGSGLDARNA